MRKQYKIYLDKKDINDATSYYINILKTAVEEKGFECNITHKTSNINSEDIVIVVKVTSFFRVFKKNPKQKIIIWFQGVQPEELLISDTFFIKKIVYYCILRALELLAIKKAKSILFVSEAMAQHYKSKYHYHKDNYFIMPCFNLPLNKESFFINTKYDEPNFVYAGSMDKWQCIKETIQNFNHIKKNIPNAKLTILTNQQSLAQKIVLENDGSQISIKYVEKELLQTELMKYKYGFILRNDITVNNVSTPTKINSYMSSGIIPIISTCIKDFNKVSSQANYILKISQINDFNNNALIVRNFENKKINPVEIYNEFKDIFNKYYNTDFYIKELKNFF